MQRAKFLAYTMSGLLASVAGLFVTFITYSGEASAANGSTYTLFSIAAVVLGGVSLFGGSGSAVGAIFGALMFRTIGDLLFVFNLEPLWQPLLRCTGCVARSAGYARISKCSAEGKWKSPTAAGSRGRPARWASCPVRTAHGSPSGSPSQMLTSAPRKRSTRS